MPAHSNFSFWIAKNDNKPDLLCGRPADYFVVQKHFMILICATTVLGGFSRMVLKNSEALVLMILSLSGFVIGRLAYHFVEVHQIVYPLLKTPSFSLYCYFLPLIVFVAALDVDFYIVKNVLWQVLLTGVISFGTAFVTIVYVVLKFNEDLWDLQCSLLFSITLCMIDPLHSVNSLKTIGISKMYTDIIRGESLIICSFTCIFLGIFRGHTTNVAMFRELHVIIGLSFDIFGSTICGYCCTRVIQIILTDLFSNTLTNVVLCFSLVYMTFYLGKANKRENYHPAREPMNLGFALLLTPDTFSHLLFVVSLRALSHHLSVISSSLLVSSLNSMPLPLCTPASGYSLTSLYSLP